GPAQQRARGLGDGVDPAGVQRGLRLAELHHPGDAQPVPERGAGDALGREVDRAGRDVLDRHAEAVAAARLDDGAHAELPGVPAEPRAGGQDGRVEARHLAVAGADRDGGTGVVHVGDLRALHDLPAPGADGVRQGVHEVTGIDVALAVQADGRADLVRQGGLDAAGLVTVEHVELHALAGRVDVL